MKQTKKELNQQTTNGKQHFTPEDLFPFYYPSSNAGREENLFCIELSVVERAVRFGFLSFFHSRLAILTKRVEIIIIEL